MNGMQSVTKDTFFAVVGPLDVHPRVDRATLRDPAPTSRWEMKNTREVIGISVGSGDNSKYFLVPKLVPPANQPKED